MADPDDIADAEGEGSEEVTDTVEGAAVFPLIPPELGVHPLLLATLHAYVFLEGSDPAVLNPAAAEEALQYVATYLQHLDGQTLRRVREDLATLVGFAKSEKWPKQQVRFLQDFLSDNGVEDDAPPTPRKN